MSAWSAASMPTAIRSSYPATTITRRRNRSTRVGGSRLTCCPAADRFLTTTQNAKRPTLSAGRFFNRVPNCDLAGANDFGIDPAVGMAEIVHERARYGHVADASVGIDLGGRAALDAFDHFEPGAADRQFAAEQLELMPGRPSANIDIAAEAQGLHGSARRGLYRHHRGEIDDGDDFLHHVGEAVAFAEQHLGRPVQFLRHEAAEECLDRQPAFLGP